MAGRFGPIACAAVLIAVLVGVTACGPGGPLTITTIQVGRSLNSDDSISGHTTTFTPDETIFASVLSEAPGAGTVSVRWIYAGRTVLEESKPVSFLREGATEFHMLSPSAGFPEGNYRVEFEVDGQPAGFRDFRVAR